MMLCAMQFDGNSHRMFLWMRHVPANNPTARAPSRPPWRSLPVERSRSPTFHARIAWVPWCQGLGKGNVHLVSWQTVPIQTCNPDFLNSGILILHNITYLNVVFHPFFHFFCDPYVSMGKPQPWGLLSHVQGEKSPNTSKSLSLAVKLGIPRAKMVKKTWCNSRYFNSCPDSESLFFILRKFCHGIWITDIIYIYIYIHILRLYDLIIPFHVRFQGRLASPLFLSWSSAPFWCVRMPLR